MTPAVGAMTWFWQAWLATIVFIFPMPHTIALRNLLLLAGLLVLLATLRRAQHPQPALTLRPAAWALVAATAWLVLHSAAVAPSPGIALDNFRGDWVVPLLTAILAAWGAARIARPRALQAVVVALSMHMIWVAIWQAWLWSRTGVWSFGAVPFAERDYQSTLAGFLIALLLADRLCLLLGNKSPLGLSLSAGWLLTAATLASDLLLRTRNGTVVALVLLLILLVLGRRSHRRMLPLALAGLIIIASIGAISWRNDARWSGLTESVSMGWSSTSQYWLTNDPATRPVTPSGAALEESAYARAAWAHQAMLAIDEHPLGLGFGRDGFGRAIAAKYGRTGMISSHSGWLDFALGAGLPGLALLLLTAGLAIRGGWRQFRRNDDAAGLMFAFLVGGYLLRCLLDGHLSGWRLGLFAFICGVLTASMKAQRREP